MEKIRKGDEVVVITGKDKGKRGTVLVRVDEEHVLVEGVNRAKKHVKPGRGVQQAGIIEKPMPLHASNVMVKCNNCNKPTRIGHERVETGADKKLRTRRVCKHCGLPIAENTRG